MALVSVIVPMRNAETYISKCLSSLLQSGQGSLEVVVVNDGSTDSSVDQVRAIADPRLLILEGPCQGVAAAFNTGMSAAQGDIITRCDADDYYPVARLQRQIDWLSRHSEFGAICGSYATVNARGQLITQLECGQKSEEITQELSQGKTRTHFCTFAVRAQVLQALGGCRPYFKSAEDIDLQLRISESCRVWFMPEIEYYYRLHDTSLTHRINAKERKFYHHIARTFQQQRLTLGSDDLQKGCPPLPPQDQSGVATSAAAQIQGQLMGKSWKEYFAGNRRKAIVSGARAVISQPSSIEAWKSLLTLLLKLTIKSRNLS